MRVGYKRLICTLCAASAAICMTMTPAQAEVCTVQEGNGCYLRAESVALAVEPAVLAEDNDDDKKDGEKTTLKEQAKSGWQIYACIGGGALVVVGIISLLAENMKKK